MTVQKIVYAVLAAGMVLSNPASASVLNSSDIKAYTIAHGNTGKAVIGDANITAYANLYAEGAVPARTVGKFSFTNQAGVSGVGVDGSAVLGPANDRGSEIDYWRVKDHYGVITHENTEELSVKFTQKQVQFSSIKLALLFNGSDTVWNGTNYPTPTSPTGIAEYLDHNETARIDIDGYYGLLALTGEDTALWGLYDSVTKALLFSKTVTSCNAGATTYGNTGCFEVTNPFVNAAGQYLNTLTANITAVYSGGPNESDFVLSSATYHQVPAPTALAILGIGLLGLGAAAARRRQAI
ncbi:PEP-CTERM sorting domain-containing protein [Magnetospirillum molischianum]|uniref:Uncharacterized protein n=1 Tax=Magnetospirillum molischianum DSM 120 TaxID=1150626 RepID=H8FQA6_MAGML|nr:PEP-CTERM sorting domain-containing protein [Magnetospirillum molischianum]CCG40544.1 exported hypothetical protein [Magnetospirillum molischianum DSM 120]